jgi:hypothetical protein
METNHMKAIFLFLLLAAPVLADDYKDQVYRDQDRQHRFNQDRQHYFDTQHRFDQDRRHYFDTQHRFNQDRQHYSDRRKW